MYSIFLKIHVFSWFLNIFVNNIVKNYRRYPGVPPWGQGNGPRGPGAPPDSEFLKFSKITRILSFRQIRSSKMSIYKAIASPSDDRQITFTCSIHLIIEATTPGNHIFDKTEEIPAFPGCLEAVTKIWVYCGIHFSTSTFGLLQLREAAHVCAQVEDPADLSYSSSKICPPISSYAHRSNRVMHFQFWIFVT